MHFRQHVGQIGTSIGKAATWQTVISAHFILVGNQTDTQQTDTYIPKICSQCRSISETTIFLLLHGFSVLSLNALTSPTLFLDVSWRWITVQINSKKVYECLCNVLTENKSGSLKLHFGTRTPCRAYDTRTPCRRIQRSSWLLTVTIVLTVKIMLTVLFPRVKIVFTAQEHVKPLQYQHEKK